MSVTGSAANNIYNTFNSVPQDSDQIDKALSATASAYGTAESQVMEAYTLTSKSSDTAITELAKKLGIDTKNVEKDDKGNITSDAKNGLLEAIKMKAGEQFKAAGRLYEMLSNLFDTINKIKDRVVNNLRA